MGITKDHAQEGLSRAYVHAVAAAARVNLRMGQEFDYGFDGQFEGVVQRGTRHVNDGYPLDFQLKCSWTWKADSSDIIWSIKTKTYNDLVTREPEAVGAILVLMCLPPNENDWFAISEESVLLRKCCYFTTLVGPPTSSENSTKQIKIPRTSILNADNLADALAAERTRRRGLFT
ncbi:DUF4365 domain-containing protein [Martelella mediterranea]|uniref:DUF4365 domain-containing protein n=1 Tax=Martelella mediterranea TaxID=293089 RepID=UPI00035E3EBA